MASNLFFFARFARFLLLFLLALVLPLALEQGEVHSRLVRRLVELRDVGLPRRVALELISGLALLAAHALVAVLAAEREVQRAKALDERRRAKTGG
jgi:hypothetical protein